MFSEEKLQGIKPGFPFEISQDVWGITTNFYYFNLLNIKNNGLLIKEGNEFVVINAPKLSEEGFTAVKELCMAEQGHVKYIIASGDWHHGSIHIWQQNFPDAKTFVVSERNFKKNSKINRETSELLDYENPSIPGLEGKFTLIPIQGCAQPPIDFCGSDSVRREVVVFHNRTGTLYITDHVAPGTPPGLNFNAKPKNFYISCNTGGFKIQDKERAKASVEEVLELQGVKVTIFGHKEPGNYGFYVGEDVMDHLRTAYEKYFIVN